MRESIKEICVVHLVRPHNGLEIFRRFLESYKTNPGGIDHDLLIIFKGFDHPQDTTEYRVLLKNLRHGILEISDEGFDITAYFTAFKQNSEQYRYFCFLNSYSVILADNWLVKLYKIISMDNIGVVAATGSWSSHNSAFMATWKTIIAKIKMAVSSYIKKLFYKNIESEAGLVRLKAKNMHLYLKSITRIIDFRYIILFDPFPNYHVRTNAFMISAELMKSLKYLPMRTKMDAYRFESGRKGLTKQILKMGKKVIVVGKDGKGYEKEDWNNSKTLWQSEQENLLVSDNQTRDYQEGSPERRKFLTGAAWLHPFAEKS